MTIVQLIIETEFGHTNPNVAILYFDDALFSYINIYFSLFYFA